MIAAALAGCGGTAPVDIIDPGDGTIPGTDIWVFRNGDTSTAAVWTANTATGGMSAVLRNDGNIEIISTGQITGSTGGTANTLGTFSASSGNIRASGVVTRDSADIAIWYPSTPSVKIPVKMPRTAAPNYSAYMGSWQGTYKMADNIDRSMTIYINEAGYISGFISDGPCTGVLYGRVNQSTVSMLQPSISTTQPGWAFDGTISGAASHAQFQGQVRSNNVLNTETGTWTLSRVAD